MHTPGISHLCHTQIQTLCLAPPKAQTPTTTLTLATTLTLTPTPTTALGNPEHNPSPDHRLEVVCSWDLPQPVQGIALSHVPGATHCLVAVAGKERTLRLCDPCTGATTHTLVCRGSPA